MTSARNRTSLLLALLAVAYCIAFVDRLMMAVVAEPVKAEFGLSDKELFLLTGAAFVLIYGSFAIVSGWLLDRYNKAVIVASGMVIWSIFTALAGFSQNFTHLAIARAGVGIGESVIIPAAMSIISDRYAPTKRPMAMGVFYAGGMVGIFLAWVLGGWVSAHFGWRNAFFIAGPPGVILAILIAFVKVDAPRKAPEAVAGQPNMSTFRELMKNAPFVYLTIGSGLLAFVTVGVVSMIGSVFVRSHGMAPADVGLIFGPVMAASMACGQLGGGWIGSKLARHGVQTLIGFSAIIVFSLFPVFILLLLAPSKEFALAALFIGMLMSTLSSPCFSAAYQGVCARNTRASAAGIHSFVNGAVGGALTPFLVGALSDYWRPEYGQDSLKYAMMVGLLSCLLSGMMFVMARRRVMSGERVQERDSDFEAELR
jgi:MFS family permease